MTKTHERLDRWLFPTSTALCLLTILYFFLLFPKDTSVVYIKYLLFINAVLIVILSSTLTIMLHRKLKNKKSANQSEDLAKKEKIIEQIIWRKRYVLQAKKVQLMVDDPLDDDPLDDDSIDNKERWNQEKLIFARKYVFPIISQVEIPYEVVSELIEKSLRGGSFGGISPPTYSVGDMYH